MSRILGFGESVEGYAVPVLNEREVRAGAGILAMAVLLGHAEKWKLHHNCK